MNADASSLGQKAVRLGLITLDQYNECLDEVGRAGDPTVLLRALERKSYLSPYQSSKLLKGDDDGYVLGGYRLLYRIAAGSFGRVFRADDPHTRVVVAIKVLRKRWSEDPTKIDLFEREGKVGLTLRHPNIVSILQVNKDAPSGQYYIVMEFVEGGNLRDFLHIRKKIEPAEALRLIEETAAGLAYALSKGLTHRDMKPTNILISAQGTAKLVDFGLAKLNAPGDESEAKGENSVDYAALERATKVKAGDPRSDIFFLGCVFYEMLTGRPPLTPSKDVSARRHQRFDLIKPIGRQELAAPPSLFTLVETMMAFDPAKRYQTHQQVVDAVREVRREIGSGADGTPETAAPPPQPSLFVVEKNEAALQVMREKFKAAGYRAILTADPSRAVDRFRQQPYNALLVDVATTGDEGFAAFLNVLEEAGRRNCRCPAIVVLGPKQADWGGRVPESPDVVVMHMPLKLKEIIGKLKGMVPVAGAADA